MFCALPCTSRVRVVANDVEASKVVKREQAAKRSVWTRPRGFLIPILSGAGWDIVARLAVTRCDTLLGGFS